MFQASRIICAKVLWPGVGVRFETLTNGSVENEIGNYFKTSLVILEGTFLCQAL